MAIERDNTAVQESSQGTAPTASMTQGLSAPAPTTSSEKTWLAVPFAEKDHAQDAGAKWDKEAKAWFAPAGTDLLPLERWAAKRDVALSAERKLDQDPQAEFAKALKVAGLVLEADPVMDGKLHRVPVEGGKKGARDGAYLGHLDARPSGFIQNFLTGHKENWSNAGMQLTAEEQAQFAAQIQLAKQQRDADLAAQHAKAAERAQVKWDRLPDTPPSTANAYLVRKGVGAHGVKFDGEKLVVPLRDIDGKLWSLQSISAQEGGAKRFEKDGRKAGNMHVIGELKPGADVLVAEGYATGASLHEATGKAVVVAFDSGNLEAVVGAVKQRYPNNPIYIMGDDDRNQKQNVGREKAIDAAQKHQVGVAFPAFQADGKGSDFNDLHKWEGLATVKAQADKVLSLSMEQSRDQAGQLATATPKAPATERAASEGDRLTAGNAVIGAAHAAQLAQVGGPLAHTAVQAAGIADAARVASDVAAGKDVRTMDMASAAASVTMTASLGGPAVQAGAKAVAGLSALDAGRRTLNTVNDQVRDTQSPEAAKRVDVPRGIEARRAIVDQPDPADAERRRAIEQRNVEVMPIPRDVLSAKNVEGWVSDDLAAFRSIKDAHERREAASAMGHSAQEQIAYKAELTRQDPEASRVVSRAFVDVQRTLIEEDRATSASKIWQEFDANFFSERHIAFKRDGMAQGEFGAERVERLVKEDLLALSLLRGHEREPQAKALVQAAMANDAYRAEFERETALWKLQPSISAERDGADLARTASRLPRHQVGPDATAVINTNAQAERDIADVLGVTAKIEELFAQKMTAKQVTATLNKDGLLDRVPMEDRPALVVGTRATLGVPSQASEEGRAKFAAWKADRDKRVATQDASEAKSSDRVATNAQLNTIEYVSARELQPDSPETEALRKQVAQSPMPTSAATAPEQAASAADDSRILDTIARMTRPELDAYVQARKTSQEQADQVLRSAQTRIEAEVDRPAARSAVLPLEDRFNIVTHVGRREYEFRDQPGKVAFTERWLSMQSTVDAASVVKAMVDRAQERGWMSLRVKGSTEFERQVWIAATARGIKAVGYEPTDGDRLAAKEERERLSRDRDVQMTAGGTITREATREQTVPSWVNTPERTAKASEPRAQSMGPAATSPQQRTAAEPPIATPLRSFLTARGEAASDVEAIVAIAAEQMQHKRVYAGQVVAHGADHFEFNEDNSKSYYVKLARPEGETTVWGVDLRRALAKGQIKVGDSVALEHRGNQPVTVLVKDRDATGRVIGEHEEGAMRNTWFAANIEHLRAEGSRRASGQEQSAAARPEARNLTSTPSVVALQPTPTPTTQPRKEGVRDPQIEAALDAAFEAKKVPQALRDGLREQVRKELGAYQARGETVKVRIYDPAASRQVQRPVHVPQRPREEQERAR